MRRLEVCMRKWLYIPVVVLLSGCVTGRSPAQDPQASPGESPTPTPAATGTPAPQSCAGFGAVEEDFLISFELDGHTRQAKVHVPPSYRASEPVGVVFNFHGYTWTADFQEEVTSMNAAADARGWVTVHGEGTGTAATQSWNAGGSCCASAATNQIDDMAFTRNVLSDLKEVVCVDDARIYATGISNGGYMSYRLACEMSETFAAIAPVAALNTAPTCLLTRPVSLLHIHGTLDLLVPYAGAPGVVEDWAAAAGCDMAAAPTTTYQQGEVTCNSYDSCDDDVEVTFCTVTGGGHTWPGGPNLPLLGHTTQDLNATEAILDFFAAHPKP